MSKRPCEDFLTRREVEGRIYWLVLFIGASHFYVDAMEPHVSPGWMTVVRVVVGTGIAVASLAFEIYKGRRDR